MKTLYERLSDENKAKIEEALKLYPTTVNLFTTSLKNEVAWTEMKFSDVISLYDMIETKKPFDFSTFINFFEND